MGNGQYEYSCIQQGVDGVGTDKEQAVIHATGGVLNALVPVCSDRYAM